MDERGEGSVQYNSIKHRICFKVIMSLFKGYLQYPFSEFIVFIILKNSLYDYEKYKVLFYLFRYESNLCEKCAISC